MSLLRKLERSWKKKAPAVSATVRTWDEKLPTCKVLEGTAKPGPITGFPMAGWLAESPHQGRVLRVVSIMFDPAHEPQGTCMADYPVSESSREQVVALLVKMGWDGRVWPKDPGWPDEDPTMEEAVIRVVMPHKVAHCLVFPSGDLSAAAQEFELRSCAGWFPLEALPALEGPVDPYLLEVFSGLTPETFVAKAEPEGPAASAPEKEGDAHDVVQADL